MSTASSSTATAAANAENRQRRAPTQARGHQRVRALLDATAELLDEVGYGGLTTKAIAQRAQTSIGSFYQFFPNGDVAVAALMDEYREAVREHIETVIRTKFRELDSDLSADTIGAIVDSLRELFNSFPGYSELITVSFRDERLQPHVEDLRVQLIASLENLFAEAYPQTPEDTRHRAMVMVVETARGVDLRMQSLDEDTQAILRDELKVMLATYLESNFNVTR